MQLVSSAYQAGSAIPTQFPCEGDNISPELSWRDAPPQAESFVLTMRNPDAPNVGGFTHWDVYNIPASVGHIEQNIPTMRPSRAWVCRGKMMAAKLVP